MWLQVLQQSFVEIDVLCDMMPMCGTRVPSQSLVPAVSQKLSRPTQCTLVSQIFAGIHTARPAEPIWPKRMRDTLATRMSVDGPSCSPLCMGVPGARLTFQEPRTSIHCSPATADGHRHVRVECARVDITQGMHVYMSIEIPQPLSDPSQTANPVSAHPVEALTQSDLDDQELWMRTLMIHMV